MRVYRLYNLTELGPASPLHFLKKVGAENYRDLVRWPYANSKRYPLHEGGSVALDDLDLRTEELDLNAVLVPELELLLVERDGLVGTCYVLPGDCFDPDSWAPANIQELSDPRSGALLTEAQRRLHLSVKVENEVKKQDPRW